MFYLSNMKTDDLETLRKAFVPADNPASGEHIPSYHYLQLPFQIRLVTLHPEDDEHFFSMTTISPDQTVYAFLSREDASFITTGKLHQHNHYELLFVLSGCVYQNIENYRHLYTPGSCCLLNKNVRHTEEFSTDYRVLFLELSEGFVSSLHDDRQLSYFAVDRASSLSELDQFLHHNLNNLSYAEKDYVDFIPVSPLSPSRSPAYLLLEQITREALSPSPGSSYRIRHLFYLFFRQLDDSGIYHTTPVNIGTDAEYALFQEITELLRACNGRMSRSALEETLHYSGDYLNKIVKKYTSLSIFDYGMTFCMKKAEELLLCSDLEITAISQLLGFTNITHFYSIFKSVYGTTPARFRKMRRTAKP